MWIFLPICSIWEKERWTVVTIWLEFLWKHFAKGSTAWDEQLSVQQLFLTPTSNNPKVQCKAEIQFFTFLFVEKKNLWWLGARKLLAVCTFPRDCLCNQPVLQQPHFHFLFHSKHFHFLRSFHSLFCCFTSHIQFPSHSKHLPFHSSAKLLLQSTHDTPTNIFNSHFWISKLPKQCSSTTSSLSLEV